MKMEKRKWRYEMGSTGIFFRVKMALYHFSVIIHDTGPIRSQTRAISMDDDIGNPH